MPNVNVLKKELFAKIGREFSKSFVRCNLFPQPMRSSRTYVSSMEWKSSLELGPRWKWTELMAMVLPLTSQKRWSTRSKSQPTGTIYSALKESLQHSDATWVSTSCLAFKSRTRTRNWCRFVWSQKWQRWDHLSWGAWSETSNSILLDTTLSLTCKTSFTRTSADVDSLLLWELMIWVKSKDQSLMKLFHRRTLFSKPSNKLRAWMLWNCLKCSEVISRWRNSCQSLKTLRGILCSMISQDRYCRFLQSSILRLQRLLSIQQMFSSKLLLLIF